MKTLTILNTSILTSFGTFGFHEITLVDARNYCHDEEYQVQSAVGHQSTCDILSKLLAIDVPLNRIEYKQQTGETALVFKLKGRPEEGKILTLEEIEKIGYQFGILVKY
jgi:hypothetical protein